jgi:hypothetical protein
VGTVTPLPQAGNARPRVFRLARDRAVINRLGFNSEGAKTVLRRLAARPDCGGIVGINIGANKDSSDRIADYVRLIEHFAPVVSYFAVNISSPNTPGLRELQQGSMLDALLGRVMDARTRMSRTAQMAPVLVKIAPDLTLSELDDIVGCARRYRIDSRVLRCSRSPRACWLKPMCAPRKPFPSSEWAVSIPERGRSPRSARGHHSSRSMPGSSFMACACLARSNPSFRPSFGGAATAA